MMRKMIYRVAAILLIGAACAQARTLADVNLPEEVALPGDGSRLVLNGAGVVRRLFVDVLVSALYLPRRQQNAGELIELPSPARVQFHVLYTEIEARDLERAWLDALADSTSSEELKRLATVAQELVDLIPDLRRGDVLAVDLLPGIGARLYLNEDLLGEVAGDEVSRALLVAWIGESPVDDGVKRAMLGSG